MGKISLCCYRGRILYDTLPRVYANNATYIVGVNRCMLCEVVAGVKASFGKIYNLNITATVRCCG